jgi:hypothetical protein
MENNLCPLAINMYYRCGANITDGFFTLDALPVNTATPSIKNINIFDIKASGCRASAGFIAGLPESPIENIRIQRCDFSIDEKAETSPDESEMYLGLPQITEKSIRLLNVKNIELNDLNVHGAKEAVVYR